MSPKGQTAERNRREMEIASISRPAARDSALGVYNREKAVAAARTRLASVNSEPKQSNNLFDRLLRALNPKRKS